MVAVAKRGVGIEAEAEAAVVIEAVGAGAALVGAGAAVVVESDAETGGMKIAILTDGAKVPSRSHGRPRYAPVVAVVWGIGLVL